MIINFSFFCFSVGSILRQGRFRRDPRQLEEEEEMWFNDDDYDEDVPTSASAANAASASTSSAASAAQPAAASAASTSAADPNAAETATTPASGATSLAASNVSSSSSATTSSDLSNSATGSGQDTGSGDAGPLAAVAAVAAVAGSSVGGFNSSQQVLLSFDKSVKCTLDDTKYIQIIIVFLVRNNLIGLNKNGGNSGFRSRECVSTGAAGARTRRSLGHHLLHPLILRLLVLCAPDFETQSSPGCTCTRRSKFPA